MQRVDDTAIVVPDRDNIDAGKRIQVSLALDVPIMDSVRSGHDERALGPLRHLVANKDMAKELLLGRLGFGDQVGKNGSFRHCQVSKRTIIRVGALYFCRHPTTKHKTYWKFASRNGRIINVPPAGTQARLPSRGSNPWHFRSASGNAGLPFGVLVS